MKTDLLIEVDVCGGGPTPASDLRFCRDSEAGGGCQFNHAGACQLFFRRRPQGGTEPIQLEAGDLEGTKNKRCKECFDAERHADSLYTMGGET